MTNLSEVNLCNEAPLLGLFKAASGLEERRRFRPLLSISTFKVNWYVESFNSPLNLCKDTNTLFEEKPAKNFVSIGTDAQNFFCHSKFFCAKNENHKKH
uniref:Uncharacterized protein n=1 Tax=Romanomermis culicivorax TaxID=13658 RepID=A0A915HJ94_ROMCU